MWEKEQKLLLFLVATNPPKSNKVSLTRVHVVEKVAPVQKVEGKSNFIS